MRSTSALEIEIQKQIVKVEAKLRKHNGKVVSYKKRLMALVQRKQEAALQRIAQQANQDQTVAAVTQQGHIGEFSR